jgi:hypothetical protein
MGKYFLNSKEYKVTQDTERIYFTEMSDRKNKVHFSFSKDTLKHNEAMESLRTFFTELYMG